MSVMKNPAINHHDPAYLNTLPITSAYGFQLCFKLGLEDPDRATQNSDTVAYIGLGRPEFFCWQENVCSFASCLGLYLHQNDWVRDRQWGIGGPFQ